MAVLRLFVKTFTVTTCLLHLVDSAASWSSIYPLSATQDVELIDNMADLVVRGQRRRFRRDATASAASGTGDSAAGAGTGGGGSGSGSEATGPSAVAQLSSWSESVGSSPAPVDGSKDVGMGTNSIVKAKKLNEHGKKTKREVDKILAESGPEMDTHAENTGAVKRGGNTDKEPTGSGSRSDGDASVDAKAGGESSQNGENGGSDSSGEKAPNDVGGLSNVNVGEGLGGGESSGQNIGGVNGATGGKGVSDEKPTSDEEPMNYYENPEDVNSGNMFPSGEREDYATTLAPQVNGELVVGNEEVPMGEDIEVSSGDEETAPVGGTGGSDGAKAGIKNETVISAAVSNPVIPAVSNPVIPAVSSINKSLSTDSSPSTILSASRHFVLGLATVLLYLSLA